MKLSFLYLFWLQHVILIQNILQVCFAQSYLLFALMSFVRNNLILWFVFKFQIKKRKLIKGDFKQHLIFLIHCRKKKFIIK